MQNSPRNIALGYLSRREHSKAELHQKLQSKGFDEEETQAVLKLLGVENLQSDLRFAQSFIHYRVTRGIGPIKIRHELKQKGVSFEIVQKAEENEACNWLDLLKTLIERKYGDSEPRDYKDKQKRYRFLQQRGFAYQAIISIL